jgi:hypothetical protein
MLNARNAYKMLVGKLEGERALRRCKCRQTVILKWILKKYGVRVWTGFIWFSIETSGGLL